MTGGATEVFRDGVGDDPAQSRAAITDAFAGVAEGDARDPEPGDQWPMLRPVLEFVFSRMPQGGTGYDDSGRLSGQAPPGSSDRS